MNLQHFGDDPEGDDPTGDDGGDENEQQTEKTFTRAQMGSIIAAEVKKATDAIEKQKAEEIETALTEAQELAKLSEDKRNEALLKKDREKFDKEREEFRAEQLSLEKQKQLVVEGLPSGFAKRVVGSNAEEILADIKEFKVEFDSAVQLQVKEVLRSSVDEPLGAAGGKNTASSEGVSMAEERNKKDKAPTNNLWG